MSPFLTIMLATAAGMFLGLVAYGFWSEYRQARQYDEQRQRLAAMHEREAARNCRPHSGVTRR